MSYFPILNVPNTFGWTTLSNFPPNNWENKGHFDRWINISFPEGDKWHSRSLGVLKLNATKKINYSDISEGKNPDFFAVLSLTKDPLPNYSNYLPQPDPLRNTTPEWRASVGISSKYTNVSYQGEIEPFSSSGSLLTFCPFLQNGPNIKNFLLFINIEKSPISRKSKISFYDAKNITLKGIREIKNNHLNIISLDEFNFNETDLPVIMCNDMAGIPLFFSKTLDGEFLSLEHTHPPASFVIHGKRWEAQKIIKQRWFSRVHK